MKFFAVSKSDDSIHILDINDVIALKKRGKTIEYHTQTGVYEHVTSLESLVPFLKQFGYERLDRDNIVNMNKISSFDPERNKVMFEGGADEEQSFTVSWTNVQKVKEFLSSKKKEED